MLFWKVKSLNCVWLFVTPWTLACQAPPSMGFSRQEYWSKWSFSSPGVFLEFPCFFYDPTDVGNLISGSSLFPNPVWTSGILDSAEALLGISLGCKLLKPHLKILSITLLAWDKCNCAVVWMFFGIAFLWDWSENDFFQSYHHCWVFQICWNNECSTFPASFFRVLNSSIGIPSPPLTLFVVMLPKDHLTSHCRMSGPMWVITPSWLSGSLRSLVNRIHGKSDWMPLLRLDCKRLWLLSSLHSFSLALLGLHVLMK